MCAKSAHSFLFDEKLKGFLLTPQCGEVALLFDRPCVQQEEHTQLPLRVCCLVHLQHQRVHTSEHAKPVAAGDRDRQT